MRAMVIDGSFGLDNLKMTERETPDPGPGQVRLRMRAASLNYRDLLMIRGHYDPRQPLPLVPCSDGVGVVEAVGEGVTRTAVGDRVCPIFCQDWLSGTPDRDKVRSTLGGPRDGTLAERLVIHERGLVHPPEGLDELECAALPCAAVTAWTALFTEGGLEAGETVLVQGTGGVSIFALQLAKAAGATVIVTSSSDEKLARARELGADETVNYRTTPEWGKAVRKLTGGRGVDHVVEVGGAGTLEQSIRATAIGGQIGVIGVLSGVKTSLMVTPILMGYLRLQGILVGHRASFEALNDFVQREGVRPVIHEVFPFEGVREGFELMARGGHLGKICVRIGD